MLRNPQHQKVALALFAGNSPEEASTAAGYPVKASSFAANARKRSQREDIRAEVARMHAEANAKDVELAEIRREYLLAQTFDELQFNLDDYLAPADAHGNREFKLGQASRALMGRVEEISIGHGQYGTTIKVKGPGKLANRRFAAELQGFLVGKHELTGKDGGPIETEDVSETEMLRRVAAFLRQKVPALEGDG